MRRVLQVAFSLILLTSTGVLQADGNDAAALRRQAGELSRQGRWPEALTAYRQATELDPTEPWSWYAMGSIQLGQGAYAEAARAFEQSLKHSPSFPNVVNYNLACAYARLGRIDAAFEQLEPALAGGTIEGQQLREDPDLENLRSDRRFAASVRAADEARWPCRVDARRRQFDFWLGSWTVRIPAGFQAGTDTISSSPDGCLIEQDWQGSFGLAGRSFSVYDPRRERWVQTWIGPAGGVSTLEGRLEDGTMVLIGPTVGPNGEPVLTRNRFVRLDDDTIDLEIHNSTDDGASWAPVNTFTYVRRKEGS